MKTRVLQDGKIVEELAVAKQLMIKTRCPDKWLLIDMETGEQYIPHRTEGKQQWEKITAFAWKRVDY